jgi:hypothetical protein
MLKIVFIFGILLNLNAQELKQIEINDFINEDDFYYEKDSFLKNAPMQKQISKKQAMQSAGSNGDPLKVIRTLAGIVSASSDNGNKLYIHGSKPRESVVFINHLPLGYLYHLGGLYSVISPEAIDGIDAYLGGFDVSYEAMGGIIDIIPSYPKNKNTGRLHFGMYDADFAITAPINEDTSLFIGARRSYFDLIADKVMDSLATDENNKSKKVTFTLFPQFYDAHLVLTHNNGDSFFSLEMITSQDTMKLHTNLNQDKDPVANGKINNTTEFTTIGARWQYMGDGFTSHTLLSSLEINENLALFDADFYVKAKSNLYKLYHESVFDLDKHQVMLGAELVDNRAPVDVKVIQKPENDFQAPVSRQDILELHKTFIAKSYVGFIQDTYKIKKNHTFRYGIRAWKTDFQNFSTGIDPRVSYVNDYSNDLSFSFSIGQYSQFPNTLSVIQEFGNPEIGTYERSEHYVLSMKKTISLNTTLLIEPYYKTFSNLAIEDLGKRYIDVGKGETHGIDLTYSKKMEDFNILVAYTYTKSKRQLYSHTNKQYRFEGDIPHTLQISTQYEFKNKWHLSSLFRYSSGKPYTPILYTGTYVYEGKEYQTPIYGEPYSKRLPNIIDLDIQIGKKFYHSDGTNTEYSIEFMNISSLVRNNVSAIKYDKDYKKVGTYREMGFLPAFHIIYRF